MSVGSLGHKLSVVGKSGVQCAALRVNSILTHQEAPAWQVTCKTPTRSKLSLPGYGTLAPIFLYAAITSIDTTV